MIELTHISKTFRVRRREAGFGSAFRALFSRSYEEIRALDDISFKVGDGETVGYIGPNGAGKSSTIKVMSGILTPDSGGCVINGRVPWKERTAHVKEIGVVFGQRSQLWWDVPVIDSFVLLRDIYSTPEDVYRRNLDDLTDMLSLSQILRTPARQLSLGQRMRCEIAASLLHSPRILFLDEPTIGLDAVSKQAVRSFIADLNRKNGTTVILTTHDMNDIEALTGRIILIGKGKILLDDSLDAVISRFKGERRLNITYEGSLPSLPSGARLISDENGRAEIALGSFADQGKASGVAQIIALFEENGSVVDIDISDTPIEDVVLNMYREYKI